MNQEHKISKAKLILYVSPSYSKVQLFELINFNGITTDVFFFEDQARLEDLIVKYKIKNIGEEYDMTGSIGLDCILSDGEVTVLAA